MRKAVFVFVGLALLTGLGWTQAWILNLPRAGWTTTDSSASHSYAYTAALAQGRTFLPVDPDPRLLAATDPYAAEYAPYRRGDLSYYRGRFYLYFGIGPYALVMVPWFKIAGAFLTDGAAIWIFSLAGLCAYLGSLLWLSRRFFPAAGKAGLLLAALVFVTANGSWLLLARPSMYELVSMAAFGCFGGAVAAAVRSSFEPHRARWLVLSGVCLGLTMACRPNFAPAVAALALWLLTETPAAKETRWRRAVVLVPLALIGGALAVFNYVRFGDPLEFGFRYQAAGFDRVTRGLVGLENLPYSLHRYLFGLPRLDGYFPFIRGEVPGPLALPAHHEPTVLLQGCLVCVPVVALVSLLFVGAAGVWPSKFRRLLLIVTAGATGNLLLLSTLGNGCYRYPVDFLAPLAFVAAVGLLAFLARTNSTSRRILSAITLALVAWTAGLTCLQVFSIAQIWSQFDLRRPADFARVARPFNRAAYALEALTDRGPRALRMTLRLPTGRTGKAEPLVVRGSPGGMDILYIYYASESLIALGLSGGPLTGEIPVDFSKAHTLEIRYGNTLPPSDHPLLADAKPSDLALFRRTLTVLLDEQIVLDGWADFPRTDGNVFIGESPHDAAYGARFSGAVLATEHPPLPYPISPPRQQADAHGPVEITLTPVPMPPGVREPIFSCGHRSQGSQLLVETTSAGQARLGLITTDGRKFWSPLIAWPPQQPRVLTVSAGFLLPPETSSLWRPDMTPADIARQHSRVEVRVDGSIIIAAEAAIPSVSPATLTMGEDRLYLRDRVTRHFMGKIDQVVRQPWNGR